MSCYGTAGPISFGDCGQSSKLTIDTNTLTKNVSNSTQQSMSFTEAKTIAVNDQNVVINGTCCPNLKVEQNMRLKLYDVSQFNDEFSSKVSRKMISEIQSSLDNNQTQITDLLGSTVGPKFTGTIKTAVANIAESNTFKNSIKQKFSQVFGSQRQNVILNCGEGIPPPPAPSSSGLPPSGCYITQNFLLENETQNLFKSLMQDVLEDESVIGVINEAKNVQYSEGKGLSDLVGAIFQGWIIIIIVIVIAFIVIFGLFGDKIMKFLGFGGDKKDKNQDSSPKNRIKMYNIFNNMMKKWMKR